MEWLLEEAAPRAAQTSWARMGYRRATEARAHSPVVQAPDGHHGCARDGPAPATAGATRTWGSRECSLSTPGGERTGSTRGRSEGAGGAPFGGGSEDGAGALLPVGGEQSVGVA